MALNWVCRVLEALFEEFGPVGDTARFHARVDEVELVVISPFILKVVDVELDIGRSTISIAVISI